MTEYKLSGCNDAMLRLENRNNHEDHVEIYVPYHGKGVMTIEPIDVKLKFKFGYIEEELGWSFKIKENPRDIEVSHHEINKDTENLNSEAILFSYNGDISEEQLEWKFLDDEKEIYSIDET